MRKCIDVVICFKRHVGRFEYVHVFLSCSQYSQLNVLRISPPRLEKYETFVIVDSRFIISLAAVTV